MIIIINSYRRTYASTLYYIHLPEDIRLTIIPYTLTGGHTPQHYTIYTYRRPYASTLYHIHLPEDIRLNLIPYTLTGGHTPQPYTIYTYGGHTPQPYTIYTYRRTYASTLNHTHLLLRHTHGHRTSLVFIIDLCSVNRYKRAQLAFVCSFLPCERHNKVVYNSHS